jgi:hypothetical protein
MALEYQDRSTRGATAQTERVAFIRSVHPRLIAGFGVAALGAFGALPGLPIFTTCPFHCSTY